MEEIWKDIEGYECLYQISSGGNVANVRNGNRKLLKQNRNQRGYYTVSLSKKGNKRRFKVHRLVAMAFIPNTDRLPQVDHINGDKEMNCVGNLRWISNVENSKSRHVNPIVRKVSIINDYGNVVKTFKSAREAAREIGVNRTTVMASCNGMQKTCAGYKLRYETA